jgi:hypothetical protein
MKQIVLAALVVVAACLSGCGRSDSDKVNARSPSASSKVQKIVTRWKESDLKVPGYGLILEQEGQKIAATLYRVEPSDGFVIKEKTAEGKFYPEKKQIVFPLFMQGVFSVDDWIAAGGSHVVVPLDLQTATLVQTTNLVGELKDMARKATYNFVRLPAEALPSALNSSGPSAR